MYSDFPAKDTVHTPYVPINVWFWPTLITPWLSPKKMVLNCNLRALALSSSRIHVLGVDLAICLTLLQAVGFESQGGKVLHIKWRLLMSCTVYKQVRYKRVLSGGRLRPSKVWVIFTSIVFVQSRATQDYDTTSINLAWFLLLSALLLQDTYMSMKCF
jgi:hypothetical protein